MRYTVTCREPDETILFDAPSGTSDDALRKAALNVAGWDSMRVLRIAASDGREIETPIAREVRLEDEMNSDLIEWASVRGISAPDF
jgi:hypothetical protein